MYSFTSGTIVSAGTSSPSMPGTQPVPLNISLASFRRAIHSLGTALGTALLIDVEAANWDSSARLAFRRGTGTTKAKTSAQQNASKLNYRGDARELKSRRDTDGTLTNSQNGSH